MRTMISMMMMIKTTMMMHLYESRKISRRFLEMKKKAEGLVKMVHSQNWRT